MKLLIRIFGGLFGLWLLAMVVGLFLPPRYRVERTAFIGAKAAAIYPLVSDLREWRRWGVWFSRDPDMQMSYSPATNEVGAWSRWRSKTQGDGSMTITALRPVEYFEYRMEFTDMSMFATGTMGLAPVEGGTRVSMTMEGDLGRSPVKRWFGLFMGKLVSPDFDAGLANLKRISEETPH